MNDDPTLPQVRRMRRWLMHEYIDHLQHQCRCREEQPCLLLMDVLILLLSKWAMIDIEMQRMEQWQMLDRESEGV